MSVEQASGHEPVELGFIESLENMISVQEGVHRFPHCDATGRRQRGAVLL